MADYFTKEGRSAIMKKVKSKGNKSTEQKLINFFKFNRITGWRRNYQIKGKPDFVFPKLKIIIFADGCFWHGHNCRNVTPKQNAEYWVKKRYRNISRDKLVTKYLELRGWKVIRIWECEIKIGNMPLIESLSANSH